jgi:hypothetical protein
MPAIVGMIDGAQIPFVPEFSDASFEHDLLVSLG